MMLRYGIQLLQSTAVCLAAFAVIGCSERSGKDAEHEKAPAPAENVTSQLKSLPTVTLTGTKIQENLIESAVRVMITASGAFGSNVIRKTDPERIIIILHNAKKGEAPPIIEVNDGAINRVEIAQLDVGKGTAVRITIGLDRKTDYVVTPAVNGLMIDVRKGTNAGKRKMS